MSQLSKNATPAEIMRGCSFSENFENRRAIVGNGGVITGTPNVFFGVDLDGTNDYITYALSGQEFNSAEISIVIEFVPHFDYDDNNFHCFFDAGTPNDDYLVAKMDDNALRIDLGNSLIHEILGAVYGPFWLANQRNVLVISGNDTAVNAWLNGNQILTNDLSPWSPTIVNTMYVGQLDADIWRFDGKINKLQIYHSLLTAQEASDFYTNETYNYMNKALMHLPMRAREHDPDNVQTLDITKNANHAEFGDGSTPATYPTKLSKRGYSFDGTAKYMDCGTGTGLMDNNDQTLAVYIKCNDLSSPSFQGIFTNGQSVVADEQALFLLSGNWRYVTSNCSLLAPATENNYVLLVATRYYDGANTTCKLYINGSLADTDVEAGISNQTVLDCLVGYLNTDRYFNGDILMAAGWTIPLTPLQIMDLYINSIGAQNDV